MDLLPNTWVGRLTQKCFCLLVIAYTFKTVLVGLGILINLAQ